LKLIKNTFPTYFWAVHKRRLGGIPLRAKSLLGIRSSKFDNVSRGMRILHHSTTVSQQEISELHLLRQCSLYFKEYFCNFVFDFHPRPPRFQIMASMIELSAFFE